MLLSENLLALWSVTIHKLVECGLGMVNIGMQYIPGRSSSPKDSEKRPLKIHGLTDHGEKALHMYQLVRVAKDQACWGILQSGYRPKARNPL